MNSFPQTEATTIVFSSVFIFLLCTYSRHSKNYEFRQIVVHTNFAKPKFVLFRWFPSCSKVTENRSLALPLQQADCAAEHNSASVRGDGRCHHSRPDHGGRG